MKKRKKIIKKINKLNQELVKLREEQNRLKEIIYHYTSANDCTLKNVEENLAYTNKKICLYVDKINELEKQLQYA